MKHQETIDIIIPSSDKYMKYVSVLMISVLENLNPAYRVFFHIMTEDIKSETITKMESLNKSYDYDIEYKYISNEIIDKLPFCINKHIDSKIVYSKLTISSLFPTIEKAIILEGDMIVTGDLSELWEVDIEEYCIAAVKDPWYRSKNHTYTYKTKPYFNTGMFYANLNNWRKIRFEEQITKVIPVIESLRFPDQDLFNYIFKDSVLYLDWDWNAATCAQQLIPELLEEKESEYILNHHKVLHYINRIKPWNNPHSYYAEYFWHYAKQIPYYEILLTELSHNNTISPNNLKSILNYRKNILSYWRYKLLYNITFGEKKEHYRTKKHCLKQQIKYAKKFYE